MEQKFTNKEIAKVMLQIKKDHDRELTKLEKKYDSEFPEVSEEEKNLILNQFTINNWIKTHPVPLNSRPGQILMPYPSYEGEDLTEEGYAKLSSLIDEFEKEKK